MMVSHLAQLTRIHRPTASTQNRPPYASAVQAAIASRCGVSQTAARIARSRRREVNGTWSDCATPPSKSSAGIVLRVASRTKPSAMRALPFSTLKEMIQTRRPPRRFLTPSATEPHDPSTWSAEHWGYAPKLQYAWLRLHHPLVLRPRGPRNNDSPWQFSSSKAYATQ